VVPWGSKSKHHKDMCLRKLELRFQILITTLHSIVSTIGRDSVSTLEIKKHALPITISNQGRSNFQYDFCRCFIVDFLLQCEFCCVDLIGRSWRTRKKELHDTHILYHMLDLRTTLLSPTLIGYLMIAQPTKNDDWFNSNAWSHITLLSWWVVFSCPPFIFNLKH
jgi:hypothetical protein